MNRRNMDKKILAAIEGLKELGKSLTVANIQQITGLAPYQIYASKHKEQLQVRPRRSKSAKTIEDLPAQIVPEATEAVQNYLPKTEKTTNIDLYYKLFGATLTIEVQGATVEGIDDTIEELTFLFKKSIARLQRERANLH